MCGRIFTSRRRVKISTRVQYPAILPSQIRQLLRMCSTVCIFNELLGAGLFLALDSTSTHTDPSTSGRKYHKSVNNAVFIRNESLFIVSAAATSAFQLKCTPQLLRSICPVGYRIRTIEYGKILVMLLYGARILGI